MRAPSGVPCTCFISPPTSSSKASNDRFRQSGDARRPAPAVSSSRAAGAHPARRCARGRRCGPVELLLVVLAGRQRGGEALADRVRGRDCLRPRGRAARRAHAGAATSTSARRGATPRMRAITSSSLVLLRRIEKSWIARGHAGEQTVEHDERLVGSPFPRQGLQQRRRQFGQVLARPRRAHGRIAAECQLRMIVRHLRGRSDSPGAPAS